MKWFPWVSFKSLSNIVFLKISYAVLVGVPILATVTGSGWGQYFISLPITLRLGYFSSLLISLAHMIYQGYCPQIIKRFESPNDLYRDLLEIKSLQSQYLPNDEGFSFDIAHCRSSYTSANHRYWFARLLCTLFYWSGIALVALVVIERSITVFNGQFR